METQGMPFSDNYFRRTKSPVFQFSNSSTITTTSKFLIDYHRDNTTTEKYGSFNNIRIANSSTNDVIMYPNQDTSQGILIKSGTSESFDDEIIPFTRSLLIENVGSGSITSNQIRINVWKDLRQIRNIAERLHEQFFTDEPKAPRTFLEANAQKINFNFDKVGFTYNKKLGDVL